jgi:thymidylate kinase
MGRAIEKLAAPDFQIILNISAVGGLTRCGKNLDSMESKGLEFHREVSKAFELLSTLKGYKGFNASAESATIHADIWYYLRKHISMLGKDRYESID